MRALATTASTPIASLSGMYWWLQYTRLQFGLLGGHPINVLTHSVGSQRKAIPRPTTMVAIPSATRTRLMCRTIAHRDWPGPLGALRDARPPERDQYEQDGDKQQNSDNGSRPHPQYIPCPTPPKNDEGGDGWHSNDEKYERRPRVPHSVADANCAARHEPCRPAELHPLLPEAEVDEREKQQHVERNQEPHGDATSGH